VGVGERRDHHFRRGEKSSLILLVGEEVKISPVAFAREEKPPWEGTVLKKSVSESEKARRSLD